MFAGREDRTRDRLHVRRTRIRPSDRAWLIYIVEGDIFTF